MTRRCVFLDRDGVINRDTGYVSKWQDFEFMPGALDAMKRIHVAGFDLVIVTNQSGIARGYYTVRDFQRLTDEMLASIEAGGARVLAVYFCPHLPQGTIAPFAMECDCRKPAPGLILRAAADHGIDLPKSIMLGDKMSDMEAATAAGVGSRYLISSNLQAASGPAGSGHDGIFASLADFANTQDQLRVSNLAPSTISDMFKNLRDRNTAFD